MEMGNSDSALVNFVKVTEINPEIVLPGKILINNSKNLKIMNWLKIDMNIARKPRAYKKLGNHSQNDSKTENNQQIDKMSFKILAH